MKDELVEGPSVSRQVLHPTSVTLKKVIPWFVPRHLQCVVNNANAGDEEILENGP